MMDRSTILGYAISLLLPATVMYGTGYNGTVDALIFTMVWILLILGIVAMILMAFVGVAMTAIGLGDEIPTEVKTRMDVCKKQMNRWWLTIMFAGWMLVALASVGWTATAVTYFLIALASQITSRLFIHTFNSLEEKLAVSTAD